MAVWGGAGACTKRDGAPREACAAEGSWHGLQLLGGKTPCCNWFTGRTCGPSGDPCQRNLFLQDCTPLKEPTLEQFMKSYSLLERLTTKKFMEGSLQREETYLGVEEDCEESSPRGERSSRHIVSNTNPFPHCLVHCAGRMQWTQE